MKKYSTTVHYDTIGELKDNLIQLHGELIGTGEVAGLTDHLQMSGRAHRPVLTDSKILLEGIDLNIHSKAGAELGNGSQVSAGSTQAAKSSGETTTNIEVDFDGIPWDARIHSSTKTKTVSGTWTKRKRLADGVYETVLAELKSNGAPTQSNVVQIPEVNIQHQEQTTPLNQVESVPVINLKAVEELITVNLREGRQGHLTRFEFEEFQQGASFEDIVAKRGLSTPPLRPVDQAPVQIPEVQIQQPVNHFGPAQVVAAIINAPAYDFKTFQGGLPNVLSELFNRKLIDAQGMNHLATELEVQQLWTVMQDQNKSLKLYDILAQRGIIQKVNFNERVN